MLSNVSSTWTEKCVGKPRQGLFSAGFDPDLRSERAFSRRDERKVNKYMILLVINGVEIEKVGAGNKPGSV